MIHLTEDMSFDALDAWDFVVPILVISTALLGFVYILTML